jgi:hypothetical protein
MMYATTIFTLFLASAQAFSSGIALPSRVFGVASCAPSADTRMFSSALDGLNREMLNDDDDVPMTKAEQKEAAKEMKAEMKKLKEEAAAAAKAEE